MENKLKGRSLLTIESWSQGELRGLLELAKKLKAEARGGVIQQRFAGKTLALLFEKRSTRTRCAFETAFGEEGGHPVFLSTQDIQLGGKESIEDTARVLGRMFSAIQFRGFQQGTVEALARYSGVPVYNGLTDYCHPTQALADIMTLEENFGVGGGVKLAFVGDGRNNVARSLAMICAKLGVAFVIIGPDALRPDEAFIRNCQTVARETGASVTYTSDLASVEGAAALYTDVWVSMGEEGERETRVKLLSSYQVNAALMERTGRKDCIFLHCLPAVKGEEVTSDVIDGPQSRAWDEAENRKHTIKALLLATL
ncbi:MAG: ornithine carbamoyltransferase [Spirochaetaceae bacterium]|jgi:ornithine carbamoyltransferase|nr:ornithine carbamoyltransferase [Spirochaetaceae bacterium]